MIKGLKAAGLLFATSAMTACGGGGGDNGSDRPVINTAGGGQGIGVYTLLENRTSDAETQLDFVAITNGARQSSGNAGELDHDAGRIRGGLLSGAVDRNFSNVNLSGGGAASLSNPAGTRYVRAFATSGAGGDDQFGVVGQETILQDLPTFGVSTYLGDVDLQAADGDDSYVLTGDARIVADWETETVETQLQNLSGQRNDARSVENVGDITISGARISDGGFSGGNVSITGNTFSLSGSEQLDGSRGRFFGPEASETGGTVVIDDTAAGNLRILGVYTAD